MRILVLPARLTDNRAAAFRALTQNLGELRFMGPGEPLPDVSEHDAIVVDGPQPAQSLSALAALRAAVERGVLLVAIGGVPTERDGFWAGLLGVITGPQPPAGEYFARVRAYASISASERRRRTARHPCGSRVGASQVTARMAVEKRQAAHCGRRKT